MTLTTINLKNLTLERPNAKFKGSYLSGLNEFDSKKEKSAWIYLGDDEPLDTPSRDFVAYVNTLLSTETHALPTFVTNTAYWAIYDNEVVGRISLRHELNDFLAKIGGHIGYIVRPSYRKFGVATEILKQVLETPRARAIGKLLLTCDEDNIASEKTIVRNGGIFESIVPNGDRPRKKRFWIDLK